LRTKQSFHNETEWQQQEPDEQGRELWIVQFRRPNKLPSAGKGKYFKYVNYKRILPFLNEAEMLKMAPIRAEYPDAGFVDARVLSAAEAEAFRRGKPAANFTL
jgi:hypothetical protein